MADHLSSLPRTNEYASDTDMNVLHSIFSNQRDDEGIFSKKNFKRLLFIGLMFLLINLPFIDSTLKSMLPDISNTLFLFLKTFIYIIIIALGQFFEMA